MMMALDGAFACIAPDQRGYGLSDRPTQTDAYHLDHLADDIAGLVQALGHQTVHIIAHDWGGLVAWHLGSRHPTLLERMVIFNAPHPYCLQAALDHDPNQRAASRYARAFSEPGAYEAMSEKDPSALWDNFFGIDAANGWLNEDDKAAQIAMWQQTGGWQAMLNWYRAAGFNYDGDPYAQRIPSVPVTVPTLLVWGDDDALFAPSALDGLRLIAPNCRVKVIQGGGHCVFREDLEACVTLVTEFLSEGLEKSL